MNIKAFSLLLLVVLFALCSSAARAGKQHTFGGGSGGDYMTLNFYIQNNYGYNVWVAVSPAPQGGSTAAGFLTSGTGFQKIQDLDAPGGETVTYTITFYTGPPPNTPNPRLTVIETDQATFSDNEDPNDHNIYFFWPDPIVFDNFGTPYDWHVTSGEDLSDLFQINNAGIAVGYLQEGNNTSNDLAFRYSVQASDTQTSLASSLGGTNNQADCINNHGDIGAEENDNAFPGERGVLLPGGQSAITIDPNNPFYPAALNGSRTVAGTGGGGGDDACVSFDGNFTDLQAAGDFPGATITSYASGVNDGNLVCGTYYETQTDQDHAFTWVPGADTVTTLLPPEGLSNASATAVNQRGDVVGYAYDGSRYHGLLWDAYGNVTDLGSLNDGDDFPTGLNDLGQAVGNEGSTPWMWDPYSGMRALSGINSVYPPTVNGINDLGEIMGNGFGIGTEYVGGSNREIDAGMILSSSALADQHFGDVDVDGGYEPNPSGSAWTFTGYSGVGSNGSLFNDRGWPGSPSGVQFAYLESADTQNSQISQTITVPYSGGYAVSFFAMQRDEAGRDNTGVQSFQVAIDGQLLGTYTPQVGSWYAAAPRTPFTLAYETNPVELTAGAHTLTFTAMGHVAPGGFDNTALITGVDVSLARAAVIVPTPGNQTAGNPFSVSGTGYDEIGDPLSDKTVTLALTGPGPLSSGATTATTDNNGTFTFSGLTINTTGTGYSFTVTAAQVGRLTFATTGAFTVNPPAPVITSFSPTSGAVGATVTITGSHFTGTDNVQFNGTDAASYTVNSDSQITVTVPTGATTGMIQVDTQGGSAFSSSNFTVVPQPTITAINPTAGPVGSVITITGTNFMGVTRVRFHNANATTYTVNSPTQITVTVPTGAGTGTITVNEPGATAVSAQTFTVLIPPTITSISPTSGPIGTRVTITGTNFADVSRVRFHNADATSYTVNSATQITVTVPSGAGTGTITVNEVGTSATSSQTFTVTTSSLPTITSIAPTSGPIGTVVTITGTNLKTTTKVRFHNAYAATFSSNTEGTQLTVTVPTGAGTGTITVTTPAGAVTSSRTFTVIPAPTITSFTPTSAHVGTVVTITGTGLSGVTKVRFHNASAVTYSVNGSGTQITVTVPSGAATGTITVTTPGGSVTSSGTITIS